MSLAGGSLFAHSAGQPSVRIISSMCMVVPGKRRNGKGLWALGISAIVLGCSLPAWSASPQETVRDYLPQKYRLLLGSDRGACGYYIDPSDVYQFGTSRFATTLIARGPLGTGCRGFVALTLLQFDCQKTTINQLKLEGDDPRFRDWKVSELSLSDDRNGQLQNVSRESAKKVCALPAKSGAPGQR